MYTAVFYNADTLELIDTETSHTIPNITESKWAHYIQEGEFDGVVDPSKGLSLETNEQRLERENKELSERVQSLEMAMDFVMEL